MVMVVDGALAPLGLDCLEAANWHCHFTSASLACYLAILFDLGVLLTVYVAKTKDDEHTEFGFDDLVDVEHLKTPVCVVDDVIVAQDFVVVLQKQGFL